MTSESNPAAITVPNHLSVPSRTGDAAEVDGLDDPVDDDVGRCFGILCGNAEFACVVVSGARRDDGKGYVGLREHLQRKRDDAVAADDYECIHAALEGAVNEPSRVLGVGPRDRDDVDTASVQLGDCPFGRVRRTAVTRRRVRQHRDATDGHGIFADESCRPKGG